jgi:hypothetical protein
MKINLDPCRTLTLSHCYCGVVWFIFSSLSVCFALPQNKPLKAAHNIHTNMKFLLLILLSALAAANGQLMTLDASAFTPLEAPEMAVFYVNEKASPTACTEHELLYLDSKMIPDIDMTLLENNYEVPEWKVTADATRRNLIDTDAVLVSGKIDSFSAATASTTTSTSHCDFCRRNYPRSYCNGMFNCGFRRQLRDGQAHGRKLNDLAADLLAECQQSIVSLSYNRFLSRSCKAALQASVCHVEFV